MSSSAVTSTSQCPAALLPTTFVSVCPWRLSCGCSTKGPRGLLFVATSVGPKGTRALATAVASTAAFTVVGGGDTASALKKFGLGSQVDHLSTGGGASLEYIEKGDLPGLSALRESAARQRVLAG